MSTTPDLPASAKRSWHRFLGTYEPLRSELYRYCRYLTRSPWEAEDLAQDTLRTIEAPTLVMVGDRDVILPEHAAQLARLVKHGQLAIFPGAQHGMYLGAAEAPPPGPQLLDQAVGTIETFLGGRAQSTAWAVPARPSLSQ